jgi:hypothetical protein
MSWYVLTHEYSDKSGFHVCGLTESPAVVDAWMSAGKGECKAYKVVPDVIAKAHEGYKELEEKP